VNLLLLLSWAPPAVVVVFLAARGQVRRRRHDRAGRGPAVHGPARRAVRMDGTYLAYLEDEFGRDAIDQAVELGNSGRARRGEGPW
jgi:hypothetical protein